MVSGQLEVYFLGINIPWVFLGFPKYNLVGTALPHLDPASSVFTQGNSRTSTPNLKTAGQSLVSQWTLLRQCTERDGWRSRLTAMHLLYLFIYEECIEYPKIFYITDINLNRFLWANIEGGEGASLFLCCAPWLRLLLIFSLYAPVFYWACLLMGLFRNKLLDFPVPMLHSLPW